MAIFQDMTLISTVVSLIIPGVCTNYLIGTKKNYYKDRALFEERLYLREGIINENTVVL